MTNYDLFTAGGGCLLGIRYVYKKIHKTKQEDTFEIRQVHRVHKY